MSIYNRWTKSAYCDGVDTWVEVFWQGERDLEMADVVVGYIENSVSLCIDKDLGSFLRTSRNQIREDRIIGVGKNALSESICYEDLVFGTIGRHHEGRLRRQMNERRFEAARQV